MGAFQGLAERTFTAEDAARAEEIENKERFLPAVFFSAASARSAVKGFFPEV
jgi:hypothetical protein